MTYWPSWHRSRVTLSAKCELKPALCQTRRAYLASWLVTAIFAVTISVASVTEHMFCGQLPKLRGNIEGVVYINISINCNSCKKYACFALHHCDDARCDGLAICMSTITYRTLRHQKNLHGGRKESTLLLSSLLQM